MRFAASALLVSLIIAGLVAPCVQNGELQSPVTFDLNDGTIPEITTRAEETIGGVFVENIGQLDNEAIRFYTASGSMAFTDRAILFRMTEDGAQGARSSTIAIGFSGADQIMPKGTGQAPWKLNYLRGNDSAKWQSGVRSYLGVVYENLWNGVDLACGMENESLKYDLILKPYADLSQIRFEVEGYESVSLDAGGNLCISTGLGPDCMLIDSAPVANYADGAREILGAKFILAGNTFSFDIAGRDPARTVIIDPMVYSTYLGGAGIDSGTAIAIDAGGAAYVAGYTDSQEFSTTPGIQESGQRPTRDIFVSKLDRTGQTLLFTTFLGGEDYDIVNAVAVDDDGCAYVAGMTRSADFPTTSRAVDTSYGGTGDGFAMKLAADGGSLIYSTFLGGSHDEECSGIAVAHDGQAYVTGHTWSVDFPVTPGSFSRQHNGDSDAFAAKINLYGDILVYSTFLGGTGSDFGTAIGIMDGYAFVAGFTRSPDFPTTPGSLNTTAKGENAFVTKIGRQGNILAYSSTLGGDGDDTVTSISVDDAGSAYIAGGTGSKNFPATSGSSDATYNGGRDIFAAKLDPAGDSLGYATYLGGGLDDIAGSLAVDSDGCAHLTGSTDSTNFPTTANAISLFKTGGSDAFVLKLAGSGSKLEYSTYLGGSSDDGGLGISLSADDCVHVAGCTWSQDIPTTPAVPGKVSGGQQDIFVAKLDIIPPVAIAGPDRAVNESSDVTFDASFSHDNVGIENYTWTFFDGAAYHNLTGASMTHFFGIPGVYWVALIVTDAVGNRAVDLMDLTILVNPIPVAEAGPDRQANLSEPLRFDGTASRDNVGITEYYWTFSDGVNGNIIVSDPAPVWTFTRPGTYEVLLTVHDSDSNQDTDTLSVTVSDNQSPCALPSSCTAVSYGGLAAFNGTASTDDVGIVNYTWNFTHNGTATALYGPVPAFRFWSPGITIVTLTVADAAGNEDSNLLAVTVSQPEIHKEVGPVTMTGIIIFILALLTFSAALVRSKRKAHAEDSVREEPREKEES
jgi:hypothetical protein